MRAYCDLDQCKNYSGGACVLTQIHLSEEWDTTSGMITLDCAEMELTGHKDKPQTCGTCGHWYRNDTPLKPIGMCRMGNSTVGLDNDTNIYDSCAKWRESQ